MTANLTRADKLPELSKLLAETEPKKEQTPDEQQAFFDVLAAAWGAKG